MTWLCLEDTGTWIKALKTSGWLIPCRWKLSSDKCVLYRIYGPVRYAGDVKCISW